VTSGARFALVALAGCLLAGCGGSSKHVTQTQPSQQQSSGPRLTFVYDASAPLGFADRGVVGHIGSVSVHDVSYASNGRRVDAYLVEPGGKATRRPGVVLVHGSGGDRRELVGTAVALARKGVVALTITAPSSSYPPPRTSSVQILLAESRSAARNDVIAVRRAADLLASRPNVDSARLGYLGWSAGAKLGTFVGASDGRFKALALLSAGADKLSAFVAAAPAPLRPLVRRQLGSVDPLRYVALARPGTLLLEDGTHDTVIPHRALLNVVHAAPPHTVVRWYPLGHALDAAAFGDAVTWLVGKLG